MAHSLLEPEQIERIRAGHLTTGDREHLEVLCVGYFESSDQRHGRPGAGALWEVTSTLSEMLQKPTITPEDGEAVLEILATADRLMLTEKGFGRV